MTFSNRNPTFRTFAGQRTTGPFWQLAMSVSSSDERSGSLKTVGLVRGMVRMGGLLLPMCWWWWSQAFYCYPTVVTFADLIWLSQNSQMFGIKHTRNPWEMMTTGDAIPQIQQGLLYVPLKRKDFKHMFMFRTFSDPIFPLTKCPTVSLTFKHDVFRDIFVSSRKEKHRYIQSGSPKTI